MVQINTVNPFQLKNFNTMIKTYGVFFLVGLLFYFFSGEDFQRKRSIFFCILFLFLLVIGIIGKHYFLSEKYKKMGLWMLYLSMMIATIGFPLLAYISEVTQNVETFIFNCIIMFSLSVIMIIYMITVGKYGRKFFSENTLAYVIMIPVLLIVPIIKYGVEDFFNAFVGIGAFFLVGTMAQYKRIGAYFEQKNMKRYGNSLDIVNKKKEGGKKWTSNDLR